MVYMTKENYYEGIKHVVRISTETGMCCEHCNISYDTIDELINHYIEKYDYGLLHIGTETSHDMKGNPWHSSVAVLGLEKNLPKYSPPQIVEIVAPIANLPPDVNKENDEK